MKKLIFFIALFVASLATIAQERTVSVSEFSRDPVSGNPYSYYLYNGGSSDQLIPTTRDTIDYVFTVSKYKPYDVSAMVTLDTIAGADTTATVAILGRNSLNDSWNAITSTTTSAVTTDGVFTELTTYADYHEKATIDTTLTSTALALAGDSVSYYVTNVVYSSVMWRYINVRLIISGDDSVGTGISVDSVELKITER